MSIREIDIAQWTRPMLAGSPFSTADNTMLDIYKTDKSVYTPSDFLQWREGQTLDLTPKFQRGDIWKTTAKSFFIDTLLRGMPIPPIYLREVQQAKKLQPLRQVVDGQQRVRAVLGYIDGKFQLSKTLDAQWSGRWFRELKLAEQQRIHKAIFPSEVFRDIPDDEVLNVFARLNTYSIPLNPQELRNGKFFGRFKQISYKLAHDNLEFWRRYRVFGETALARMLDVEFTSELLIAGAVGMQHKKNSISGYYKEWDEVYPTATRDEQRLRTTIATISDTFEELDDAFTGVPLFYTLYCTVFHRLFGLPELQVKTPKKALSITDRQSLKTAVTRLSEVISGAREDPASVPRKFTKFAAASTGQTTNIEPRTERVRALYEEAFG